MFRLFAASVVAAVSVMAAAPPLCDIEIREIRLQRVTPQSVEFAIRSRIVSGVAARIKSVSFHDMSANGLKFHLAPIKRPINLIAGKPVRELETLTASFPLSELTSIGPVLKLLRDGAAEIRGSAKLELELASISGPFRLSSVATMSVQMEGSVPVEMSGLSLGVVGAGVTTMGLTYRYAIGEGRKRARSRLRASV